jgi:hypothetical protein
MAQVEMPGHPPLPGRYILSPPKCNSGVNSVQVEYNASTASNQGRIMTKTSKSARFAYQAKKARQINKIVKELRMRFKGSPIEHILNERIITK